MSQSNNPLVNARWVYNMDIRDDPRVHKCRSCGTVIKYWAVCDSGAEFCSQEHATQYFTNSPSPVR